MGKGETISNDLPIPRQCRAEQMTNRSRDGNGWPTMTKNKLVTGARGDKSYHVTCAWSRDHVTQPVPITIILRVKGLTRGMKHLDYFQMKELLSGPGK